MTKKSENNKSAIIYLIIAIIFLILFIVTTLAIKSSFIISLDDKIHDFILKPYSELATTIYKCFTFLGSTVWIVAVCAIVTIYSALKKHFGTAAYASFPLIVAMIINVVVKHIVKEARPIYMVVKETTYSFPSGHSTGSTAIYMTLLYLICRSNIKKVYKWFFSILLIVINVGVVTSRIYLGAHYFHDIFAGICTSLAVVFLAIFFDKKKDIVAMLDNNDLFSKKATK